MTDAPPDIAATHSDPRLPARFAEFWRDTLDALAHVPTEWERIPNAQPAPPGYTVDWLRFSSWGDTLAYGWLAVPDTQDAVRLPGYLWLPGYSLGNPPPGPESLYAGVVTFGLNLHGNPPDTPYVHPHTQNADYITLGIDSPETYIFRAMICHALMGLRVLGQQEEVDERSLFVGGMSQGGGLALVVAALDNTVKLCLADMPWLCDPGLSLALAPDNTQRGSRRPPDSRVLIRDYARAHPERAALVYETYRYFDPLSHAASIQCPTQMSAGGRDPSCRPPTIYSVYNALTCPKDILYLPHTGHDIVPAQHEFHAKWVQHLTGEHPHA